MEAVKAVAFADFSSYSLSGRCYQLLHTLQEGY